MNNLTYTHIPPPIHLPPHLPPHLPHTTTHTPPPTPVQICWSAVSVTLTSCSVTSRPSSNTNAATAMETVTTSGGITSGSTSAVTSGGGVTSSGTSGDSGSSDCNNIIINWYY